MAPLSGLANRVWMHGPASSELYQETIARCVNAVLNMLWCLNACFRKCPGAFKPRNRDELCSAEGPTEYSQVVVEADERIASNDLHALAHL